MNNTTTIKYIKFLLAGFPSFIFALPLNYYFVESLEIKYEVAYFFVLLFQVTLNFLLVNKYVFISENGNRKFPKFFIYILSIRLLDWMLYALLVKFLFVHYLVLQVFNIIFFSWVKFIISKRIFEGK